MQESQMYERSVTTLELGKNNMISIPSDIVFDLSRVSWMDGSSSNMLKTIAKEFASVGIHVSVAACSREFFRLSPLPGLSACLLVALPKRTFPKRTNDLPSLDELSNCCSSCDIGSSSK